MNPHFEEMLRALFAAEAEFLIVGAQAVAAYGYVRATKDIDIWISPTPENAKRVWHALVAFGAPLDHLTIEELATPGTIYQIGIEPNRIDIINDPAGLDFDEAWSRRVYFPLDDLMLPYPSKDDLIRAKRAAGRYQDLADIEQLEKIQ